MKRKRTIVGAALPNIPWEERPKECRDPMWRYSGNPVIQRDLLPTSNSIFNSAVVPFKGGFAGVFRCDNTCREMKLHVGHSCNGFDFEIDPEPIPFMPNAAEDTIPGEAYDPRVCWLEDRYYVTFCNVCHGPTIGMAYTHDFKTFHQMENAFLPYNRNGVLFPRRINGQYALLSRPSDTGHTPFGDIFYSESPDLCYWGKHRYVMGPQGPWQSKKIGPGPIPIETTEGWLLIYHGVLNSCSGFVYHIGAALLDLDRPWKVLYRGKPYLLSPQRLYECVGDVPNVVFPCAALADADTGRLAVYYGCADSVTGLAFAYVDEVIDFVKTHSMEPHSS